MKKFYRYDISLLSDQFSVNIKLSEFKEISETKMGYWIENTRHGSGKMWISKTSRKRYAYPTLKEAKISFIRRTERRYAILNSQMVKCRMALENVDELVDKKRINSLIS